MKPKIWSAALLVAGTAIGAGMLALPVVTAEGGFWPACFIYLLSWLFAAATGLLLLEACLWLPKDANIISLASHLLGLKGKIASWALYLFLFYCLMVAYAVGGGGFITSLTKDAISAPIGILLFVLIFSPFVYAGTRAVDRLNFILMTGLVVSFVIFVLISSGHVELSRFPRTHWSAALFALPVIFTSFSYQGTVPSLVSYFQQKAQPLRKVIIIGSLIPLFVYVIWELLILGIVPLEGAGGLLEAKVQGDSAVMPLKGVIGSPYIYALGQAFAFFALTTSFLGVALGLMDFLADGLKLRKEGKNRAVLYACVFLPPAIIAMLKPTIFLRALGYAGGIGCALLLGLIPVLMVWSGRYRKKLAFQPQLPGGKASLLLLVLFIAIELVYEFMNEIH